MATAMLGLGADLLAREIGVPGAAKAINAMAIDLLRTEREERLDAPPTQH
jgi:hypothetical protein